MGCMTPLSGRQAYLRVHKVWTAVDTPLLFCETIEEAIDEVAKACGGRKQFAAEMWPSRPVREAHNRFDACLNPERAEKFDPVDLLYIMRRGRKVGCHSLIWFMARDAGYTDPLPVEPEDERAKLQREYIEATRTMQRLASRMERAGMLKEVAR